MDNLTRLHYLQALGIDVWIPKVASSAVDLNSQKPSPEGWVRRNKNKEESLFILPPPQREEDHAHKSEALIEPHEPASNDNWEKLQAEVAVCTRCGLCETRTQTVFGSGNKNADWMIIGEAPGQHEDQQGLPFVGNAGLLLTEMLRAIGLSREDVFITNILKCRPSNNRDPKPDEAQSCNEYLQRQSALIKPKIILAVGCIAAQTLLQTDAPLSRLRGKVHTLNNTPVIVVYHPAYLLRSPSEKRKAWLDLQLAMQTYKT
ncbi:Phage SPO1 DNA polymerase-related protein [Crenothrix polyspora]|uniref:Type-4 uracil-DNA glycosylase n=1 Tax=Crenothrix polyspora TaxID=360316 RepID=A0A1R4H4Y8_9GAMM|nr:uracil-DNA glycosylase [Crenothrix polyspora]SJM91338.1 Phage SPO1 DNA polymerase-related protein [Crenothrix polyspora]